MKCPVGYYTVLALGGFCLVILVYLLLVNIMSRYCNPKLEKLLTPSLCYLSLLHITSIVLIATILLKHVEILPKFFLTSTIYLCNVLNHVFYVSSQLVRWWIGLIWWSRYKFMLVATGRQESYASMIILGFIVHLPILSIPFGIYYEKTKWPSAHDGGHICIFHQPPWVSNSWMIICLSISTIFLLLFMTQAWKAFQTSPQGKNKLSDSLLCTTPPLKITPQLVRNSTIRNALVTLCSVCGLVTYYGVFDNEIISIESERYTRYL